MVIESKMGSPNAAGDQGAAKPDVDSRSRDLRALVEKMQTQQSKSAVQRLTTMRAEEMRKELLRIHDASR